MTTGTPIDLKYVSLLWAGPDRAACVAKLHAELFDPAWSEESILALLDHPASTAFLAVVGNPQVPVGFVMGQIAADDAEILSIGVTKAWQRKGVGQKLVEGLARAVKRAEGKRLFLEVATDNDSALGLYNKSGFLGTGLRRGYYDRAGGAKVDALTLTLKL